MNVAFIIPFQFSANQHHGIDFHQMTHAFKHFGPKHDFHLASEIFQIGEGKSAVILGTDAGLQARDHSAQNDIGSRRNGSQTIRIERCVHEAFQFRAIRFERMAREVKAQNLFFLFQHFMIRPRIDIGE